MDVSTRRFEHQVGEFRPREQPIDTLVANFQPVVTCPSETFAIGVDTYHVTRFDVL